MPSMKEIATVQAARLYEKSMRSTSSRSTPLKVAMEDQTSVRILKGRSTLKREAELRLAQVGLMQLPRAPLPSEPGSQILRNVCFHYSPCSKQDQTRSSTPRSERNAERFTGGAVRSVDRRISRVPSKSSRQPSPTSRSTMNGMQELSSTWRMHDQSVTSREHVDGHRTL